MNHSERPVGRIPDEGWGREDMKMACSGYYPVIVDSRMGRREQLIHTIAILKQRNDGDPLLKVVERELQEYNARREHETPDAD